MWGKVRSRDGRGKADLDGGDLRIAQCPAYGDETVDQYRQHHRDEQRGQCGQIAAGVVGGLIGGALLGGALAARPAPPPVYYAPEPVYIEEPACRLVRERYWDGYGWQFRRVQICN